MFVYHYRSISLSCSQETVLIEDLFCKIYIHSIFVSSRYADILANSLHFYHFSRNHNYSNKNQGFFCTIEIYGSNCFKCSCIKKRVTYQTSYSLVLTAFMRDVVAVSVLKRTDENHWFLNVFLIVIYFIFTLTIFIIHINVKKSILST